MSTNTVTDDGSADVGQKIKEGLNATRERMDHTIDELTERLDPRQAVDGITEWLGNTSMEDAVRTVKQTTNKAAGHVGRHPVPYALAGAGVAWLAVEVIRSNRRPDPKSRMDKTVDSIKDAASTAGETITDKAAAAKTSITEGARNLADTGEKVTAEVKEKVGDGVDTVTDIAKENPIAVGGGILALGLLAGLLIPRTRTEDKLMGGISDGLLEDARDVGRDALKRGKEAVHQAVESATA
ncbi:MAG: ElaB/YqjD/DUF883 family membrane-anchored ribosome-binding protein [Verrucomicrobiales bacterium]|jgi:ElaB/YqjD/DUF883 family membrane-anchored ribosome-binding protein